MCIPVKQYDTDNKMHTTRTVFEGKYMSDLLFLHESQALLGSTCLEDILWDTTGNTDT